MAEQYKFSHAFRCGALKVALELVLIACHQWFTTNLDHGANAWRVVPLIAQSRAIAL
jgi:hypothetical protein